MSNTAPKLEDLPKDLAALISLLRGMELVDRVIDNATFEGSSVEAVAAARTFVRNQHAGILKNIKEHPQADLVMPKEKNDE